MAKKTKYYVVWVGNQPGIYSNWQQCQAQIKGFPSAKYKSFNSRQEAENAYARGHAQYVGGGGGGAPKPKPQLDDFLDEIVVNSIAVDAACSGNPGKMEYRGVYTVQPETELFRSKVYPVGTNNIGEFLALVHALALYHKDQPELVIYSDSKLAMGWIEKGKCRSKLVKNARTAELWSVIERGEKWLATHTWTNKLVKWETKRWGEIPADFGRK